jgi:hypothetical protein
MNNKRKRKKIESSNDKNDYMKIYIIKKGRRLYMRDFQN